MLHSPTTRERKTNNSDHCTVTCIVNVSWYNLWALVIGPALHIFRYTCTVLMSPNKDETAVHCCDPQAVLVMLVSRNVFRSSSISLAVFIVCLCTFF